MEDMDCPVVELLVDSTGDEPPAPWITLHLLVCEECRRYFEICSLIKEGCEEDWSPSGPSLRESDIPEERLAYRWMLHWEGIHPWNPGIDQ